MKVFPFISTKMGMKIVFQKKTLTNYAGTFKMYYPPNYESCSAYQTYFFKMV